MPVQLEAGAIKRFRGLSRDPKPGRFPQAVGEEMQYPPVGSVFTEIDTGARYIWRGSWPWVRQEQTVEALLQELIEVSHSILQTLAATQRGHEAYDWDTEVPPE